MRLEYQLKFRDWLLFSSAHQLMSVRVQVLYLLFGWVIYTIEAKRSDTAVAVVMAVIFWLFLWILQLTFNAFYLYSSKNRTILTSHVIEVRDDAFYEETRFSKSMHYWTGVTKVVRRPGFAAVYVTGISAHVIPRRAFSSDAQLNEFVAMVQERIRAAQQPASA